MPGCGVILGAQNTQTPQHLIPQEKKCDTNAERLNNRKQTRAPLNQRSAQFNAHVLLAVFTEHTFQVVRVCVLDM